MLSFAFSTKEEDSLPPLCVQAAQVLGDIEKTAISQEVGDAKLYEDGMMVITYQSFKITVKPDGTFHGRRLTNKDRTNGGAV
jgi:hypothetical protein